MLGWMGWLCLFILGVGALSFSGGSTSLLQGDITDPSFAPVAISASTSRDITPLWCRGIPPPGRHYLLEGWGLPWLDQALSLFFVLWEEATSWAFKSSAGSDFLLPKYIEPICIIQNRFGHYTSIPCSSHWWTTRSTLKTHGLCTAENWWSMTKRLRYKSKSSQFESHISQAVVAW